MALELLADGSKRIHISRVQFEDLCKVLRSYSKNTKCEATLVIDLSGMLVSHAGPLDAGSVGLLATLIAGNYAATNEMARVVGEQGGFRTQFLEGSQTSIYVAGIDESFLFGAAFGSHVTFGMIRVQAGKAIDELRRILSTPGSGEEVAIVAQRVEAPDFQSELSSRLDAVLFSK